MSPPPYQTEQGYREPSAAQLSVFLANRVGQLKDLLDVLAESGVRVLGLSVIDATDWAVVRCVVSDVDLARAVLGRRGLRYTERPVLLVKLTDSQDMSAICGCLVRAEINIHFAYPLTVQHHEHAVMVFHVDDTMLACRVLRDHGMDLLGQGDLSDTV